jgi:hypothetical protein
MKSRKHGASTFPAEVTHISAHGIWLLVGGAEYFLPHESYPWFKKATIAQVMNLQQPHPHHLHWPDLDVDLEVESLRAPDAYPLVYS